MMRNYIISFTHGKSMNLEEKTQKLERQERLGYNMRRDKMSVQNETTLTEQKRYKRLKDEQMQCAYRMMTTAAIIAII